MRDGRLVRGTLLLALVIVAASAHAQSRPTPTAPALAFAPSAYARGEVLTPDLARRIRWPESAQFRQVHHLGAGARPIRLLHGRLMYWERPGAAAALGPSPSMQQVFARGEEVVRLTRRRDREREAAGAQWAGVIWSGGGPGYKTLSEQLELRQAREGQGWLLEDVVLALAPPGSGEPLRYVWFRRDKVSTNSFQEWIDRLPLARWLERADRPFVHAEGDRVFAFQPAAGAAAGPIDPAAWQDWTYATTLMWMPGPVYEDRAWTTPTEEQEQEQEKRVDALLAAMKKGTAEGLAAARTLLQGAWLDDAVFNSAAEFAEDQGELDLAIALRARWRPMGSCSMDSTPQWAARRYAELCHKAGRLGCFLNLQVQIMGDQFPRVASSSYGEEAHATEAQSLRDIGIDVQRFLRGLLYRFAAGDAEPRRLDSWRLARSIREAGLGPAMGSFLVTEAQRPTLDPYNRFRALETLAYLWQQELERAPPERVPPDEFVLAPRVQIRAALGRLSLTPEAQTWLAVFGSN